MRHSILILAGLLAVVAWPTDLAAQRRGPGPMAAPTDSLIDVYTVRLNLTNEQAEELEDILSSQFRKAQEMFDAVAGQGREAMAEMRPKMQRLYTETDARVEALLTEEQIPEYRKVQAEIREARRSRMRRREPGA